MTSSTAPPAPPAHRFVEGDHVLSGAYWHGIVAQSQVGPDVGVRWDNGDAGVYFASDLVLCQLPHPPALAPAPPQSIVVRVDRPDPDAIRAEAWLRTVRTVRELAQLCNPLDVDRIDVADRLPHLAEPVALERFTAYAEVQQQLDALEGDDPATATRWEELNLTAGAMLADLLAGHPYSPGWTGGGTAANAVRLGELANRYREDARDARAQRDRELAAIRRQLRTVELTNAELAQVVDDLSGGTRYWPAGGDAGDQVADVLPLIRSDDTDRGDR